MDITLSLDAGTARKTVLHLQGLTLAPHIKQSTDELYALIEQLGLVQLDSIQWVERAHHMILFARNQTYRPHHLTVPFEKEQRLFENWTHDASLIPSIFYPYWRHKFTREESRLKKKFHNWQGEGFTTHIDGLMDRIRKNGALMSRDLEKPTGKQEMWQWHDGKAALEYLWRIGDLAIKGRRNFQKIYDLPERCLLPSDHERLVSEEGFINWACRSALDRLGFGSPADIARFWDLLTIDEVKNWLIAQDAQTIRLIEVTGKDKQTKELAARPDIEDVINNLPKLPDRIRALSPFDPVIRDRKRLAWLWGFDYRIEIYVPEAKRVWGYYVFPLLEKDRLIGRIDMRADRKRDILTVRKVWLEKGVKFNSGRAERLQAELVRQARLAGVQDIEWNQEVEI